MMLTASYVLITLGGRADQVRAGMTYVVISLLASTLFVTALGAASTRPPARSTWPTWPASMGDAAGRAAARAFAVLLLVVFGIKAALFPLFFWLPDSYPTAPSPVTAVFAGLLTKVGVYAIIRTQTLLFPGRRPAGHAAPGRWPGLTMVVGVLGAIAQDDVKRILSFHIVSQIGYMVMGLGLFTVAGLAGAVFYIVHHIVGEDRAVPDRRPRRARRRIEPRCDSLGGLVRTDARGRRAVPACRRSAWPASRRSRASSASSRWSRPASAGTRYVIVGVASLVSLLTLFSMMKIWTGVFWSPADASGPRAAPARGRPAGGPGADGRPDGAAGRR